MELAARTRGLLIAFCVLLLAASSGAERIEPGASSGFWSGFSTSGDDAVTTGAVGVGRSAPDSFWDSFTPGDEDRDRRAPTVLPRVGAPPPHERAASPVPEPGAALLFATGLVAVYRRTRSR